MKHHGRRRGWVTGVASEARGWGQSALARRRDGQLPRLLRRRAGSERAVAVRDRPENKDAEGGAAPHQDERWAWRDIPAHNER